VTKSDQGNGQEIRIWCSLYSAFEEKLDVDMTRLIFIHKIMPTESIDKDCYMLAHTGVLVRNRPVMSQLSAGPKARIVFAIVLLKSILLLLDEPTNPLDMESIVHCGDVSPTSSREVCSD
jgi:ATPase subunit of ABC transporter with duplicated ATPase domains